jgi:ribonucleoside-triphosphate reductase
MTIQKIRKRDGAIVDFDQLKITRAIFRAAAAIGGRDMRTAERLSDEVTKILEEKYAGRIPTVENIQDIVEKVLIERGHARTAKAYILYRKQHEELRKLKSVSVEVGQVVDNYLNQSDWRVRENSNVGYSLSGLLNYISGSVIANYTLYKTYPIEVADAHMNGDMHIHDLSMGLSGYCAGWSLRQLLLEGFNGVPDRISSKQPAHLDTALLQMVNFIGSLQNEWAGAQAFNSVDTYLAPFVRKDGLSYKQVKQAIQTFVFNLNIASRWGSQTPFTNITFDWTVPEDLAGQQTIVGDKGGDGVYGDYQEEMALINRAFLEIVMEGDMNGRPFTFPIPTYSLTKDFDWTSDNASKLFEMTARYGSPYFQNFINSDLKPSDVRSMCLYPGEEILIRNGGEVMRTTIGSLVKRYAGEFDEDGWAYPQKAVQVLSVNPETFKVKWANVKKFLRVKEDILVEINTEDGKSIKVSANHLVPILTPQGLKLKFAKEIKPKDILLTVRSGKKGLNNKYQRIGDFVLDEWLAGLLGFFTADGNYLFESRKKLSTYRMPKGIQFTFNSKKKDLREKIKELIVKVLGEVPREHQDPRYNTSYLYVEHTELARLFYNAGFRKYGRLPQALFDSPPSVIEAFLDFFFLGDGCRKEQRIHINDEELARDLLILSFLVGRPTCYIKREKSQKIRFQYKKAEVNKKGYLSTPTLYELVPGWVAKSTYLVPGLNKKRMVGTKTLERYNAHTKESEKLAHGDVAYVRVKKVKVSKQSNSIDFYDVELEKNHLFVHSLGAITHNCCHLRLDLAELRRNVTGGLFGSSDLTGSVGVVTINMPRLGYLSRNEDEFFERLEYVMGLAKNSLEHKRELVERNTQNGLLPYTKRYLGTLRNHFSTIGLVGMNEACLNLLGCGIASEEGKKFSIKALNFMRERLREFQEGTGNLYNLEATPAEGTSYRLAKIDRKKYPEIITAGDKTPYYTNSSTLPVDSDLDLFEAMEHQEDLQTLYSGGTVFHIFLGESLEDGGNCGNLVRKVAANTRLPYFTLTPTFSICPDHGYLRGKHFKCPTCGRDCEVYSRVVGYYRPVRNWNEGKQEEFRQRREFA